RRLAWPQIEAVRIDIRTRFGARAELLELDAGEEIYQLSRYELGVDPVAVAVVLESLRAAAPSQPG
ncbi:MAG: PH domain-containing protein, partial [Micromonosporaceae bacterium]